MLEVDSSGVIHATGNLEKFAEASKKAEQSAQKLERQGDSLDDVFSRMNVSSLAAVAGVTALVTVLNKIGSSLMGAVNTYAGFEKIEVGLSGVMKNLGETKKASDDFLKSLKVLSNETTFGYNTLADAAQQMITVGVSTNEVKTRLIQLGNAAGGSTEKFNRLAEVYTKILATGKAGAMQLQQLSTITGTSFVNALGKTNATAEEVTEQIEKLTSAGGMLEGAMDSLIDTVEGKQGFVSDWFDEMTRNFADASGLVDVYKGALDILSSALETLAGWFARISESPLGKAILSGALAAALGVIVTVVGVALVNAIVKLNAQLAITATLKSIINPAAAAVGIAMAAIVGATIGISSAMDKAKKSAEELKEALDKFDSSPVGIAKGQVSAYDNQIKASQEYIKKLEETKNLMKNSPATYYSRTGIKVTEEGIKLVEQGIVLEKERIIELEKEKKLLSDNISLSAQFDKNKEKLDEIITGQMSSSEKALKEIQETMAELERIKSTNGKALSTGLIKQSEYDIVTKKLDGALDNALSKEREIKIKIANESLNDWQKFLKSAFGFSDKEIFEMGTVNESNAFSKFGSKQSEQNQRTQMFRDAGLINIDNLTLAEQKLENINKLIQAYANSDQSNIDKDSIEKLKLEQNNAILDVYNEQIAAYDKQLDLLRQSTMEYEKQIKIKEYKKLGYSYEQGESLYNKEMEVAYTKELQNLNTDLKLLKQKKNTLSEISYIKKGYTDEQAKELAQLEKTVEIEKRRAQQLEDIKNNPSDFISMFNTAMSNGLTNAFQSGGNIFSGLAEGLSQFSQGLTSGAGAIGMLIQAIMSFVTAANNRIAELEKQMYGDNAMVTNPFEQWIKHFDELFKNFIQITQEFNEAFDDFLNGINSAIEVSKPLMLIVRALVRVVGKLFSFIGNVVTPVIETVVKVLLNLASFGLWGFLTDLYDSGEELSEAQQDEAERLRELNDEYAALYDAIKEQEEYYLTKKNELNADTYKSGIKKVNDMILTDKGVFSTDPKDTIMAMKRPGDLLGGGNVYVTVNNNAGVEVETQEKVNTNGMKELIVNISRSVAADYASGANGWDSAYGSQQSRLNGRRVSI